MANNTGFVRNILRSWLDATAEMCIQTNDTKRIRTELDAMLKPYVVSDKNRRMATSILLTTWAPPKKQATPFHTDAIDLYRIAESSGDHLALHYGLTMLTYNFFRTTVTILGQMRPIMPIFTSAILKQRVFATYVQYGAVDKAVERVIFSLRNWEILTHGPKRSTYAFAGKSLAITQTAITDWLLAATLYANPDDEMRINDLMHRPELFPFTITRTSDELRRSPRFMIHRQGIRNDIIALGDNSNREVMKVPLLL